MVESYEGWSFDDQVGHDVGTMAERLQAIVRLEVHEWQVPPVVFFKRQLRTWGQLDLLTRAGVTGGAVNNAAVLYGDRALYEALVYTHLTQLGMARSALATFGRALRQPVKDYADPLEAAQDGERVSLALRSYHPDGWYALAMTADDHETAGLANVRADVNRLVMLVDRVENGLGPMPKTPGLRRPD